MARPKKATVDYFPHNVNNDGKTMFVLESKWGNDGFSVWFKMLEQLGKSDGHFIDCRDESVMLFLATKTRVSEDTLLAILDALASLNAIDRELWKHRLIFCQHFVDGVAEVYRRRKVDPPTIRDVYVTAGLVSDDINPTKTDLSGVSDDINPSEVEFPQVTDGINRQSRVEESRVEKSKEASRLEIAFDEMMPRLKVLRPHADHQMEKAKLLETYKNKGVMDPNLLIITWYQKLSNTPPVDHEAIAQAKRLKEAEETKAYYRSIGAID